MNTITTIRLFFAIILSFIFIQTNALACTCSFNPLSTESIQNASNIFVFRIISAKVRNENISNPLMHKNEAKIKVVDRIYGEKYLYSDIHFSTSSCCGSRLDVGRYYVAFISEKGPDFLANNGNIIDIGEDYYPDTATEMDVKNKILKILSKKAKFEDVFGRDSLDRIEQSPVLPPCIQNKRRASVSQSTQVKPKTYH